MEIIQKFLTENDCYKKGQTMHVVGIMVHSTGVNNPNLSRYVGPNKYNNDWNRSGVKKCVHAFIGKNNNGEVQVVQTLPWNMRGWHAGTGTRGSANDGFISFEMCEDDLTNQTYMFEVYYKGVRLCAELCVMWNLNPFTSILSHKEGHDAGIASDHVDPEHWWAKYLNDPMYYFRQDVADEIAVVQAELDDANEVADNKQIPVQREYTEDEKWAIEMGLFFGDEKGNMRFDEPLTRGQLCTVLRRAEKMWFGDMNDGKPLELLNDIINQYQEKGGEIT